ncbi:MULTISPECIES: DNA-binding protein [unclassified Modicisalibacter]|uniref:DNA-binding protein n=1 Tax=unclassified Modicisalibacter TaxID=2679913 RepID=UPI001CCF66EC|nr:MULTISPECIES: DNA-binding protein [unclassified Modicisalibacter]MBZ9556664.1 DNA-binding protein [Modicisalibacter sp. R2A 31.J]MBZ9574867.1 DNA-binding protein [Modicisalibacter sp. MOD 31.J]
MARSGVQYEDVRRAIDTLLQRGETPGVQKVREVLGTGSFTTISDHLREWRAQREENRDQPPAQAIPEPVEALMQALWEQAQQSAVEGLAHYREEADRAIEQARAEAERARREAEDARQREAALNEHLVATQAQLQESSARLARLEAALEGAEQRETQLGQQRDAAHERLTRLQADNERLVDAHQSALAEKEAEWRQQLTQEEQRNEAAEARLMTLLDDARQERQRSEKQFNQRLEALETRLRESDQTLQAVRGELAEEQATHREAQWALKQAESAREDGERREARLAAELADSERARDEARDRQRDLEARLARAPLPPFVY